MHRRHLMPALAGLPLGPRALRAQPAWVPERPVRLLVGFAAGGNTDTTARVVAQAIAPLLGQQVLVENRSGAGGNVASEAVAHAAPDGCTLVMGTMGTHAVNQALFPSLPFHVVRDFAAVSLVATTANLVVVRPGLPVRSVAELVALGRQRPGGLNCGTGGTGSSQHFSTAQFEHAADVRFTLVHYRGGTPAIADLVAGRVDVVFAPFVEAIQQVRAGQVRALATTRAQRLPEMPELPAVAETVPGYVFTNWLGVFAPAATPAPVMARLSGVIQAAMRDPAMKARMAELGYDAVGSTAEDFAAFHRSELPRTAQLVRSTGATVD